MTNVQGRFKDSQTFYAVGPTNCLQTESLLKFVDVFKGMFFSIFNVSFNLKSHNFKANSASVYKLSRFARGRISLILFGIIVICRFLQILKAKSLAKL